VKKLFVLVAVGLLILAASCDTLNIGGGNPINGPAVTLTAPAGAMFGMETHTFTATWQGGTGPYTIAWNFGGGGTNIPTAAATSPATADVTWNDLAAETTFNVTVTVTDNNNIPGTASATVTVGPTQNQAPTITATAAGGTVTVTVADADNDDVTVSVTPGSGFGDPAPQTVAGGNGTVTFNFASSDIFGGSTGDVTFTADDGNATADATVTLTFDPFPLAADTLYAVPMQASVGTGDPVTVIVATGATGSSFQFMTGVGLVFPDDGDYVSGTFNVGLPGGATDDADGVWAAITSNGGFLLPPDSLYQPGPDPDGTLAAGTHRFDFNVTPLGGSDVASAEGALFNAQFSFTAAGDKTFSFQQVNGVNRTYYSDFANGTDTFWGSFVDGTVTVN